MALDVGKRVIGIAVSDPLQLTARPLTTLVRQDLESDTDRILEIAKENEVERILVGAPQHLDGQISSTMTLIQPLVQSLDERSDLVITLAEERLSSKEAERLMAELQIKPHERRKRRDEFAAALILTWFLEEKKFER